MIKKLQKFFGPKNDSESRTEPSGPIVSIVLIVYDMADQAENTVRSLMTDYQIDLSPTDYEVIVVENESSNLMSKAFIDTLPANFKYFLRAEDRPTPIYAVEFGASQARGENICLMIDGARLLTPGVISNLIAGHRIHQNAIVTVPGYHLGSELQQEAVDKGYSVEKERQMMASIDWPIDGYRLFDIACFSGSSARGVFLPNSESNCISIPRRLWNELGGCDQQFDMRGGGLVNLDFYKRACETPDIKHIVLHGEATIHQYHGGVTTGGEARKARDQLIQAFRDQYSQIRGHDYKSPQTNPIFLGTLTGHVQRFIALSSEKRLARDVVKPLEPRV
jgi:hypothetical protein